MKLIIVHFHLRPGGIRRIIELAAPPLARRLDAREVIVATGERGDRHWTGDFKRLFDGTRVRLVTEPSFRYTSEQRASPRTLGARVRRAVARLLDGCDATNCVVWIHNPGIARNLILTRELTRGCSDRNIPLVAHHHDWWFDNRWLRWTEMRRFGFGTLRAAAAAVFTGSATLRHATINEADARILRRHFPGRVAWLPNLTEREARPDRARLESARRWLDRTTGETAAPVWIVPCRLLRRKNVGEAILLARWLRPEAWLVTTGGVSSADEAGVRRKLAGAARQHQWRVRLGILRGAEDGKPCIAELLAVSEAVLLTSIQEGFGLPYIEAAAAERPLIARMVGGIAPDLAKFGFRFPQRYREILVDPSLFDWRAERERQAALFHTWRSQLPRSCYREVGQPAALAPPGRPRPVPFARLTLTAQLEVLAHPAGVSWKRCAPLNPFVKSWQRLAHDGNLRTSNWPASAAQWLGGAAYAERFQRLLKRAPRHPADPGAAVAAQEDFQLAKLSSENLFPLLWSRRT